MALRGIRLLVMATMLLGLGAAVASAEVVQTNHTPSVAALGKVPKDCTDAATGRCIATGAYGSVSLSPHVLRPGSVLKAKVTPSSECMPCLVTWPITGPKAAGASIEHWLQPIGTCKPQATVCRWKVAAKAPFFAYLVITFDLVPASQPEGVPSVVSDYAGLRSSYELVCTDQFGCPVAGGSE